MFMSFKNGVKSMRSEDLNYDFKYDDGFMAVWGKTPQEDPQFSPYGPFILDCEVTTKCDGGCPYCYKSNTAAGVNMSFDEFRKVVKKVDYNRQLTQVAFGLGRAGDENPDLWRMCDFLRSRAIVPNGTVANISDETAYQIATHFGGVAVSAHTHWPNWLDILADNVKRLADAKVKAGNARTLTQINCHFVIAEETFEDCKRLIDAIGSDPRFADFNAIVLLSLKKCGRAKKGDFTRLADDKYRELVSMSLSGKYRVGFDSCAGNRFLDLTKDRKDAKFLELFAEPCESTLFSSYVNVEGKFFPCSFCEPMFQGLKITEDSGDSRVNRFRDSWEGRCDEINHFKKELLAKNRSCPVYEEV
jgi:MoaA/NifB/PqqE/SkfB family radical SAM enzyme